MSTHIHAWEFGKANFRKRELHKVKEAALLQTSAVNRRGDNAKPTPVSPISVQSGFLNTVTAK